MKIGITCHTGSGGSGILATELGLRMAAHGHEVHFIARESPFRLPGYVDNVFMRRIRRGNEIFLKVFIRHASLDSKPSASSWHEYRRR